MNVLLMDGQTIQTLPFLESLNKLGIIPTLYCEDKESYAKYSKYKKNIVYCNKIKLNEEEFYTNISNYLKCNPHDLLIPLFNDSAEFCSKYKEKIEELGCKVEIPTWDIFIQGHDKEKLMDICKELNIPHPRTSNPRKNNVKESFEYVGFPCLIKPNLSAGAKGIKIINNKNDFNL